MRSFRYGFALAAPMAMWPRLGRSLTIRAAADGGDMVAAELGRDSPGSHTPRSDLGPAAGGDLDAQAADQPGDPAEPDDEAAVAGDGPVLESEPATDDVLAVQAALGDRAAFAAIVRRHGPSIHRYALRMLDGDEQSAEDAVQEAFIDAWLHLPAFRGDAALHTWLFRLGANRVLRERRHRRPVLVDDQLMALRFHDGTPGPSEQAQHAELWQTLDLALGELPWRQRASWILRELEGLGYEDIAQILQTTPTVVRGQLHRARRALAIRMEQWR